MIWLLRAKPASIYAPPECVVPASWRGTSPFVEAKPLDDDLRPGWWKPDSNPDLNTLVGPAMAANPDLQDVPERFVQACNIIMMKARAQYFPRVDIKFGDSHHRRLSERILNPTNTPRQKAAVESGILTSWKYDVWSAFRNATRVETYRAQEQADDQGPGRWASRRRLSRTISFIGASTHSRPSISNRSISITIPSTSSTHSFRGKLLRRSTSPVSNLSRSPRRRHWHKSKVNAE